MQGLKIHTSNRLESSANQLAEAVSAPLSSPFAPEIIIVQSRGMARWVSLQIAQISGICMNFEFPFPRAFIERTLRAFFSDCVLDDEFSAEVMAWKINRLLPSLAQKPELALVRSYLQDEDGLKTFQLSERIARLFDQYLVYRPEMLTRWERDENDNEWQAILWRDLVGGRKPTHLASMYESLSERMAAAPKNLPERISVFGISSLPPFYLRVLFELSRQCEVNLFSLHPSKEYYGHDLPPKLKAKFLRNLAAGGAKISEQDFPTGNPILSSMGRLNRDYIEVLLDLDERSGFISQEEPAAFVEPNGRGMLQTIQGDILHARTPGDAENPKTVVTSGDYSIQIHACHSPMREVEVLYDHLLDLLEKDPTLKPRDILVMTPDIEKYAPFIHTVFAYPEDGRRYIPFSVADRRPRSNSPIIEAFLSLLALPGSRCAASDVFSVLDRVPIRRRFAFTDEDMTMIRRWIVETGIRWGIDAAHRGTFHLPEIDANTWHAGLRRLLLGYAMAGKNRMMFEGIMPHDEVEGAGGDVLGRFVAAVESLLGLVKELAVARPLSEWGNALGGVISQFFLAETQEEVGDVRVLRIALEQLRRTSQMAGGDQVLEFRVLRYHLAQLLDQSEQRGGFLTGGVTFCALQPMRSIPARVICLIGMGDQAFPRQTQPSGFDLMARDRRCGDRSARDDDRYIFLEALISARERLYASYVGRSVVDNEDIPPSVLVSELLDYLDQAFIFPEGKTARSFAVTEHRLHAFSPRYFDGESVKLFSYSEANAAASRNLQVPSNEPAPAFFGQQLPPPGEELRGVQLRSLIDFFGNPAKHFVRYRLGLRLEEQDDALADDEPFELDNLERYLLKQELVSDGLEKQTGRADAFVARGLLPLGEIGLARFQTLSHEAQAFCQMVEPELRGQTLGEPILVDLRIGSFSLTGSIESLYGNGIVQFRCATLKGKDRLRAWITHLAKCAASPEKSTETILVGTDETVRFSPVADAPAQLEALLEIYWRGLGSAAPFFPATSLDYAKAQLSISQGRTPLEAARLCWNGAKWFGIGERYDRYYDFCFGEKDLFNAEFEALSMSVFEPMLQHTKASG